MGRAAWCERLDAPASAVWNLVRWDNEAALIESGAFARVEYEERRPLPGATRWLHPHEGPPIRELLETIDGAEMRYSYRLLDPGPMPLRQYVGEVAIDSEDQSHCRLSVACTFETLGISEAQWIEAYEAMQKRLFEFLRGAVTKKGVRHLSSGRKGA